MAFDIVGTFKQRLGENYKLHAKFINPAWAKVTQLIGYDKVWAKAEGCYLWDTDGQRTLDCVSGFCVSNIGHNHPVVRQALRDALNESLPNLIQLDCSLLPGLLAEALVQRIPWLDMVYFGNSGSEAIEAAIKFARASTGKQRILYADHSYHGVSYGALSVTGHSMWREGFEPLVPDTAAVPYGDADALEKELAKGTVAGVLMEPIQVGAGIIVPPPSYLPRVQELCRKHKALFIMDEIHTGFGRTGTFLASEQWKLEPDIVCLSKGLSGEMVPRFRHRDAEGDHQGRVLAARPELRPRLDVHGEQPRDGLRARDAARARERESHGALPRDGRLPGEVALRAQGEVRADQGSARPRPADRRRVRRAEVVLLRQAWTMMHKMHPGLFAQAFTIPLMEEHRILTQVAGHNEDVLKVAPALVVTKEDIDYFTKSLDICLKAAHSFPGPFWEVSKRLAKNALF
jgi:acetylornithine/succinyldiaminopimelate/putrescine aminotransferase